MQQTDKSKESLSFVFKLPQTLEGMVFKIIRILLFDWESIGVSYLYAVQGTLQIHANSIHASVA